MLVVSLFSLLSAMFNLKEVDLSRCSKITDAGIRHLLSVPALEKLCISETGVTAEGVAVLSSLTNLLMLDLGGLPVTDSALSSLQVRNRCAHCVCLLVRLYSISCSLKSNCYSLVEIIFGFHFSELIYIIVLYTCMLGSE